jgi:transcriptional regulator with XRE-family HTH domain
MGKIITDWQCRAARSALSWAAQELADAASLSRRTVEDFERGKPIKASSIERIAQALEDGGIVFDEKGCVCRRGDGASPGTTPVEDLSAEHDE